MSAVLVSTTDAKSNMEAALGDAWKTPPEAPAPAEAPKVTDDGVLQLDRLDPKEFKEVRDAQERDKRKMGRNFSEAITESPDRKVKLKGPLTA